MLPWDFGPLRQDLLSCLPLRLDSACAIPRTLPSVTRYFRPRPLVCQEKEALETVFRLAVRAGGHGLVAKPASGLLFGNVYVRR